MAFGLGFSIRERLGLKAPAGAPPRRRMFGGAAIGRLTADWVSSGTSQDAEVRSSMRLLRNRARQLCRDNDYARQAVRVLVNNVVGTGVQFQSQVRMQRGGGRLDSAMNDVIEGRWRDWCRKDSADISGLLCFAEIERLAVASVVESGEVFIRMLRTAPGRSPVPLALQVLEADMLDDNWNGTSEEGNEIRMGVEVDEYSRPVAYHFYQRHPGDFQYGQKANPYRKRLSVPAAEVIHLYKQERPGQTRGVTRFASALARLHHMEGYADSELIAARAGAALMGFVTSPEGSFPEDDIMDGQRVLDWAPGQWKFLAPGESVTVPPLNRPVSFEPFMRQCLRSIAAGVGVPYPSLSADYSQTNYSSSRLELLEARDGYRAEQSWLIENLHQRVFDEWLDMAALSGALNLPGYESDPSRYNQPRWLPRGWAWVDPQKEVASYKEAVRCGFMTQGDVIAQGGNDIEELFAARERELQMAEDLGLVFDTDPAQVDAKGAGQGASADPALSDPAQQDQAAQDQSLA
jgi:lambda family phage portal protein